MHVELPGGEENQDVKTAEELGVGLDAAVPQSAYRQYGHPTYGDCYSYTLQIRCPEEGISYVVQLLHKEQFSPARLQEMVDETIKVMVDCRISRRRRTVIVRKAPIMDQPKTNQNWFDDDARFFETAMCDKFNFRKLVSEGAVAEIPGTLSKNEQGYFLKDPGPMRGVDPDEIMDEYERRQGK